MPNSIRFTATIRYWNEEKQSGLAVVRFPARFVEDAWRPPADAGVGDAHDGPHPGARAVPGAGAAGARVATDRCCDPSTDTRETGAA